MILRRGLREPDVAGIAGKLAALKRPGNRVAVADLAARRVDEIGAALHLRDHLFVEEIFGLRVQRRVDRDDVADTAPSDSTSWWKVTPSSCSTSAGRRWRSV